MVQQVLQTGTTRCRLYLAVLVVNLLFVSTGCVLTWPSPVLVKLGLSEEDGSWVSSIAAIGGALGPILNAVTMPHMGRKPILLLNGLVFLVSWVILMFWTSFAGMMVGRLLGGVAVGLSFLCIPLYITEAADNEMRQAASSLTELFIGIGYLVVYGSGPYISYFILQVCCLVAVVLFLVPFVFMPESPYYLISKGDRESAARSLAWFRAAPVDSPFITRELDQIQESFSYMKEETGKFDRLNVIKKKGYRKALFLGLFVLFIQQMSGICVVTSFNEPILDAAHPPIPASLGSAIFGIVNIFSSAVAPPIVKRYGTKKTMIFCFIVMTLSLLSFSVYSYLERRGVDVRCVNVIPVLALVTFNIFFCIGGGPLPWSLIAELSPAEFRGFNYCVIATFSWTISFILMRSWAPTRLVVGDWAVFAFFALFLIGGIIVILITLPDTKGLSLAEVQKLLSGEKIEKTNKEEKSYEGNK